MQIPTLEAIKEQMSEELDEQLPGHVSDLVIGSALKTSSKRKRRVSAKKNQLKQGTSPKKIVHKPNLESAEGV